MISVIIPVKNEGENIQNTLDSFLENTSSDVEYIVVDDESDDHCCDFIKKNSRYATVNLVQSPGLGSAKARNFGAQFANGDVFVFADAHITVPPTWTAGLLPALEQYDCISPAIKTMGSEAVGYGTTVNKSFDTCWNGKLSEDAFSVAMNPGGFLMIKKAVFYDIGEWQKKFVVWGCEDTEISIRLQLFGYRSAVVPSVVIEHLFRTSHPYPVELEVANYNLLFMAYLHFDFDRLSKIRSKIQSQPFSLNKIEGQVLANGALEMRQQYFDRRKHDDDWYFSKYNIEF